ADGRLPRRMVPASFVDPDIGKWIGDVPRAAWTALHLVVAPAAGPLGGPAEDATPAQLNDFVRAFGRRRLPQPVMISGWIKVPPGASAALGDGARSFAWKELSGPPRPDVPGALPLMLSAQPGDVPTQLHVRMPDGTIHRIALDRLTVGR